MQYLGSQVTEWPTYFNHKNILVHTLTIWLNILSVMLSNSLFTALYFKTQAHHTTLNQPKPLMDFRPNTFATKSKMYWRNFISKYGLYYSVLILFHSTYSDDKQHSIEAAKRTILKLYWTFHFVTATDSDLDMFLRSEDNR